MSVLTLVRHGQARAFEQDSDRLSETGQEQARRLGEHWAGQGLEITHAFSGTLRRQTETAAIVAERFAAAGGAFPTLGELEGFNEYPAAKIFAELAPQLAARNPAFGRALDLWREGVPAAERNRHFQPLLEGVMQGWIEGELAAEGLETWEQFRLRVAQALAEAMNSAGGGATVVVFTSGGPIGLAVQTALAAPDRAALEINWRVRNASLTSFLFSGARRSLDLFNATPHLSEARLITFR